MVSFRASSNGRFCGREALHVLTPILFNVEKPTTTRRRLLPKQSVGKAGSARAAAAVAPAAAVVKAVVNHLGLLRRSRHRPRLPARIVAARARLYDM